MSISDSFDCNIEAFRFNLVDKDYYQRDEEQSNEYYKWQKLRP